MLRRLLRASTHMRLTVSSLLLRCVVLLVMVSMSMCVVRLMPMIVSVARAEHLHLLCSLDVLLVNVHRRLVDAEEAALRLAPIAGQVDRLAVNPQIVRAALVAKLVRQIQVPELVDVARIFGGLRVCHARTEQAQCETFCRARWW